MPKRIKKKTRLTKPGASTLKMSEVIADFAAPLLKEADDETSASVAISIAVMGWNLAVMPEDEQEDMIKEMIAKIPKPGSDAKYTESIARMMISRKKELFSHIKKLIVGYDIKFREGKMLLNVVSTQID